MFLGHAGAALAARRGAPGAPLALLLGAAYLLDLLWPIFLLLGWEQVRIVPGITAMSPLDFVSYPISHSLVTAIAWGALLAIVVQTITRNGQIAAWSFAMVVSHWVIDLLVHRRDLPLWPGGHKMGFGLWNVPAVAIALEVGLLVWGLWLYLKATRPRGFAGHLSLWSLVVVLAALYFWSQTGPPPPDQETLARYALVGWVFIPWCMWIDRTREDRPAPASHRH
jgi:membrane-bound metal-dependent hydrolase YbcI (DUF457 family)